MGLISGFAVFAIALVVLVIIIIFAGVKTVPQGQEHTVERFGRYTRTLSPGLHVVVPLIDNVRRKVNMMEQVKDVPSQEVITEDNVMVTVDGVVYYQILNAAKAAYEIDNVDAAIINLTMTNMRSVMGGMKLDEVLSNRDVINERIVGVVDEATSPWGLKVTRIEIMDLSPPREIVDAMAQQMKADRNKRAAVLEAEGDKAAAILRAEGQMQSAILEAEGDKQSAILEAEARERAAQAEARATHMVSQAVNQGSVQALNYFVALKYVDSLQAIASAENQKLVFMPLEAANMIGAIGGIAELASDALEARRMDAAQSSATQTAAQAAQAAAQAAATANRSVPRSTAPPPRDGRQADSGDGGDDEGRDS